MILKQMIWALCLLNSCGRDPQQKFTLREFAFNDSHLQVITSLVNDKANTMSVLYGNHTGNEYKLVTYEQQPNAFWYGSKINGALKQVETVDITNGKPAYSRVGNTAGVIDTAARIGFILAQKPAAFPGAVKDTGFAVVELFTSEGCSSCPPADKLLAQLQNDNAGKPVYILSYHVDYWDHQGWKDRFSAPEYTERQKRYAERFNLQSIYTPQAVINGAREYVGSNTRAVTRALTDALETGTGRKLVVTAKMTGKSVQISYETDAADGSIVLALVQPAAQSRVRAGENAGRELVHVQIVRQLAEQPITGPKTITMALPEDFKSDWQLVAMVQQHGGAIQAAASTNIQ